MLDVFLWGDAERISPEAPVPVVRLGRQTFAPGGAANVAANIAGLGGRAILFAVTGADAAAEKLRSLIAHLGIESPALLAIPGRPTSTKFRIFARSKHMLRCDRESTVPIPVASARLLMAALANTPDLDAVIVSDYAKGLLTPDLIRRIGEFCRRRNIPWCADPKQRALCFRHADLLKPNLRELESLAGLAVRTRPDIRRAAARLLRRHACGHVLVTLGAKGMACYSANGRELTFPGIARSVADVTGAGDTVSAVIGLGLAVRLPLPDIAFLANLAGAYVVSQPGIAIASAQALLDSVQAPALPRSRRLQAF